MVSFLDASQGDGGAECSPDFPWLPGESGKIQGGQEIGPRTAGLDSDYFLSIAELIFNH